MIRKTLILLSIFLLPLPLAAHTYNSKLKIDFCNQTFQDPNQIPDAVFVVAPIAAGLEFPQILRAMIPENVKIVVLRPSSREVSDLIGLKNIAVLDLPQTEEELQRVIQRTVKRGQKVKVLAAAEPGVDKSFMLKKHFNDPTYEGALTGPELVSKSAIRKHLMSKNIPNLIWPKQFTSEVFESDLQKAIETNPTARWVIKFDNSSGMDGLKIEEGSKVFSTIAQLEKTHNKHGRRSHIIVEEMIDDIKEINSKPIPEGSTWAEIAFDGILYSLEGNKTTRIKPTFVNEYEKTKDKMYLQELISDGNSAKYAEFYEVIQSIVNELGIREGAFHFEMYVLKDQEGHIIPGSKVILGDPNFRLGGNNKYNNFLYKAGIISHTPQEMQILGMFDPESLHKINFKVVEDYAQIVTLSFPSAPQIAKFSADPSFLIEEIHSLPTVKLTTFPWNSSNYQNFIVGKATTLPQVVDVLLFGDNQDRKSTLKKIRQIEEDIAKLMKE